MAEYIDRQKLVNALRYEGTCRSKLSESPDLLRGLVIAILIAQKEVETADVEEVKHGHWVFDNKTIIPRCSVCGEEAIAETVSPYCPWCGAKCDEDDE